MKVAVNKFVKKQYKGSGKTFSNSISFSKIALYAEKRMISGHYMNGYRKGIRIVKCDRIFSKNFHCPIVKLTSTTKIIVKRIKRELNEETYLSVFALNGKCLKTGFVELVLYSHDTLLENNENDTLLDWELISINAIPKGYDKLPMKPSTMMRNQQNLTGGTITKYPSKEWSDSVYFWNNHAMIAPENP